MVGPRRDGEPEGDAVIRILIADDHAVLRAGLRMLLDAEPDMRVIGEAGDGVMALALVCELTPDVVLLDLTMPRTGGLETLRQIREMSPQTRVLILTMHDEEGYLREALAAGSAGYVLKRAADIELLSAIRAVHRGGTYLHAAHTRVLFEDRAKQRGTKPAREPGPSLSSREEEVLRLIALGYTSRQAAVELNLSAKTVETYRGRLMTKLNLRSRVDLVRYALQRGLLEEE
jgi:two-component system response regulator NreC